VALGGLIVAVRVQHHPSLGAIVLTSLCTAVAAALGTILMIVAVARRRVAGAIPAPDGYGSVLP
jgi:hypothetical protein